MRDSKLCFKIINKLLNNLSEEYLKNDKEMARLGADIFKLKSQIEQNKISLGSYIKSNILDHASDFDSTQDMVETIETTLSEPLYDRPVFKV